MRDLADIEVRVDREDYEGHVSIDVTTGISVVHNEGWDAFGPPTEAEYQAAAKYVAGLLARVALMAQDHLAAEAVVHGCNQPLQVYARTMHPGVGERRMRAKDEPLADNEVPHVTSHGCSVSFALQEDALWFSIPKARVKPWLALIDGWLYKVTR
jgi:hypothetical protein